ncbi:hypothetical protein [Niabella hibiscisoli]|uniref:hypothetical protein n=1 Tax=Niabella hibiscisoli TaxID=1825928 RepID=UPI001F1032C2|nr:hypothetical protein [Niabella hibiscisoli]MCH5716413.1 hypothetical protein [Niabella hibiscisoli]
MRDLLALILIDWRTLIRGWLLCFALSFPFMFLPTIVANGWLLTPLFRRIPQATLYAGLFALAIIIAAVAQNYQSLAARKRIFDQPAFERLSFYGRLDGLGSMSNHIETFLVGKISKYFFRINIIDPGAAVLEIKIVPFIDLSADPDLMKQIEQGSNFPGELFFGQVIGLTQSELQSETILFDRLKEWDKILTEHGALPINVDVGEL